MAKTPHGKAFESLQWEVVEHGVVALYKRFRIEVAQGDDAFFVAELFDKDACLGRSCSSNQGAAVRGVLKLAIKYGGYQAKCQKCDNTLYPKSRPGIYMERCLNKDCSAYRKPVG